MNWMALISLLNKLLDIGKGIWSAWKKWKDARRKKNLKEAMKKSEEELNTKDEAEEVGKLLD